MLIGACDSTGYRLFRIQWIRTPSKVLCLWGKSLRKKGKRRKRIKRIWILYYGPKKKARGRKEITIIVAAAVQSVQIIWQNGEAKTKQKNMLWVTTAFNQSIKNLERNKRLKTRVKSTVLKDITNGSKNEKRSRSQRAHFCQLTCNNAKDEDSSSGSCSHQFSSFHFTLPSLFPHLTLLYLHNASSNLVTTFSATTKRTPCVTEGEQEWRCTRTMMDQRKKGRRKYKVKKWLRCRWREI